MGIAEHIYPSLSELDFRKTEIKVKVVLLSFVVFAGIYTLSALVGSCTWTYRKLRTKEKIFWNLAIVRAVFGVFATVIGIDAIFFDKRLDEDAAFGTTPTSYIGVMVTEGFFLFECTAVMISDVMFRSISWLLNLHHWLALIGFTTCLHLESSHFFATKGLILEMSTPFSAVCWTLLKCGKAQSLLWNINQFFLVHAFHCRSIVECFLWYEMYKHWTRIWEAMPWPMFVSVTLQLFLVTFVMTPYWTYKKSCQWINPVDWNFTDSDKNKTKDKKDKKNL